MPELPDVAVYIEALTARIKGRVLSNITIRSPFVVRTVQPSVELLVGRQVTGLRRIGKQIVFQFDDDDGIVLGAIQQARSAIQNSGGRCILSSPNSGEHRSTL